MKPSELYAMEGYEWSNSFSELCCGRSRVGHIPEIELSDLEEIVYSHKFEKMNSKMEMRVYKNHNFDGRRRWVLASIWFEGKPVMIIQNAGREGDDHTARFITDHNSYAKMVAYLLSFKEEDSSCDVYRENEDIPNLTEFYGYSLEDLSDN